MRGTPCCYPLLPTSRLFSPDHRIGLSSADPVGWWRPAVDVLFQSAREVYEERTVAIRGAGGGIAIVQSETTSGHFDILAAALDLGRTDVFLRPQKIGRALRVLAEGAIRSSAQFFCRAKGRFSSAAI